MSLFAIADLHLSLGTNKPMDVFKGWENYIQRIEDNWRRIVTENDIVVVAGDISWAMSLGATVADFTFLESLPGKKILIKGNHDYWWDTMTKMGKFLTQNGFSSIRIVHNSAEVLSNVAVCGTRGWFCDSSEDHKILLREAARLDTSIGAAKSANLEPVVFLHYPPVYASFRCEEIMRVLHAHGIKRCYFGHLHGRAAAAAFEGEYEGILFRLISCDHTGFSPVIVEKGCRMDACSHDPCADG